MSTKKKTVEEPEEPSRTAGWCVLVVLATVVVAVVFALSPTAGVLTVWVAGTVALWRAVRRMSDSSATPPPQAAAPESDIDAAHRRKGARAVFDPIGVMCIIHAPREEVNHP
jgi:hypothetical protein